MKFKASKKADPQETIEVLLTIPDSKHSAIPLFISSSIPKSSALTIRYFSLIINTLL